jgi:hypothetical protein
MKHLSWTINGLAVIVLGLLALAVYWVFEPDPLEVNYVKGGMDWSACHDRKYSFSRDVKVGKDITVYVKEYWWNIDGLDDIDGKMTEFPHRSVSTYTLSAGTDRVFQFQKIVPTKLTTGRYRYRPHAEYKINPIKTIRRDLPIQYVNVLCEYDSKKHGVME